MNVNTLGRIVRDEVDPSFGKIVQIANALSINIHWLATGKGEMSLTVTPGSQFLVRNESKDNRGVNQTIILDGPEKKNFKQKIQSPIIIDRSKPDPTAEEIPVEIVDLIKKFRELNEKDQQTVTSLVHFLHKSILSDQSQRN
jgi:hypothetical protein